MLKAGRNDPCPCGSGKKMKKCCAAASPKKFEASVLSSGSDSKLFSLFNKQVAPVSQEETTRTSLAEKVNSLKN